MVLVMVVIAAAGFIIHRQRTRNNEDRKVEWKIPFSELDFAVKKSVSGSRKVDNGSCDLYSTYQLLNQAKLTFIEVDGVQ